MRDTMNMLTTRQKNRTSQKPFNSFIAEAVFAVEMVKADKQLEKA